MLHPHLLNPQNLKEDKAILERPEVQSLLGLVAVQALVNNSHTIGNTKPEEAFYLNRAILLFLDEIQNFQIPNQEV